MLPGTQAAHDSQDLADRQAAEEGRKTAGPGWRGKPRAGVDRLALPADQHPGQPCPILRGEGPDCGGEHGQGILPVGPTPGRCVRGKRSIRVF